MSDVVTKVWVEAENCTSCEACVAIAPEVLEMNGDVAIIKAEASDPAFLKAQSESIIQAAQDCPCEAIKYETA
ncbi:MAG TPA: ferredoxin [Phycisphaerae bacterium]|nr:ferredoxin [Phycisphaerae bacterium]